MMREALPDARGPGWLYVFPCAGPEDLCKLGFTSDPVQRIRAFHPRFYEFFDCARARVLRTERLREAHALEQQLARRLRAHRAPAPLTFVQRAGGRTEWYRGAEHGLARAFAELSESGYGPMLDLVGTLRTTLEAQGPLLRARVEALQREGFDLLAPVSGVGRTVLDALDALRAFDLDPARWMDEDVAGWHRRRGAIDAPLYPVG